MPQQKVVNSADSLARSLPILTFAAALVYAGAVYFLLFAPKVSTLITGGSLDVSGVKSQIGTLTEYEKNLDDSLAGYNKLNPDRKEQVSRMVTREPGIQDLFVQTDAIATQNGFVLTSIDAVADDKKAVEGRRSVRIAANINGGTYEQLKSFLADMENSLRIADVQSVVFTSGAGNFGIVFRSYFIESTP